MRHRWDSTDYIQPNPHYVFVVIIIDGIFSSGVLPLITATDIRSSKRPSISVHDPDSGVFYF